MSELNTQQSLTLLNELEIAKLFLMFPMKDFFHFLHLSLPVLIFDLIQFLLMKVHASIR